LTWSTALALPLVEAHLLLPPLLLLLPRLLLW
jgi:hypothetical protein